MAKKYKVGDKFIPEDRTDIEFEITSRRGANAMNKYQPRTYDDFKEFSQPQRKSNGVRDMWF